ncbi:ABC transporter permease [Fructobacillus ficulneus]|uniref:Putative ABC transporter, integral membrane protein n=1 Tax=Fructobacillus ficulneus TaxID=157463 RepID=A0A0K8MJ72_9LACO|nr:ABC transporter permease [Fructobacillus ficulneus]GAP00493.1 putative ABC transporter, integral membrane protein [Fructobacillus ficulneus]
MLTMMKRNLLLYFRNRSGVIFSLLGALISFVLYIIFLKKGIAQDWNGIEDKNQLLDMWLISGTLTVTGITTTFTSLGQSAKDREQGVSQDLLLTDLSPFRRHLSYVFSAALTGFLMQIVMLVIMVAYFALVDQISFPLDKVPILLVIMVLSALTATLVNDLIVSHIQSVDALSKLGTIIGTASGFLVGTYFPIGNMPDFAQALMKLTPGAYIAALFRQVLMGPTVTKVFTHNVTAIHHFDQQLGIRLQWTHLLSQGETYLVVTGFIVIAIVFIALPSLKNKK